MPTKEQLVLLRQFVEICKNKPETFHLPELAFFRDFMESYGATIPPLVHSEKEKQEDVPKPEMPKHKEPEPQPAPEPEPESEPESDIDLDMTGVVEPDNDPPLPMGEEGKETTEEMVDLSDEKRTEAQCAIGEGDYEKALGLFTEAIELNPGSALLHAKRANVLLHLNKPNAAIRDCDKAISINPDSAQGYKFRGRANRLLGHFDKAFSDLATGCKLDYDDQANAWMKEVEANAKKLIEHKRKHDRKKEDKEERKREERRKAAKEAYEKAKKEQEERMGEEDDYEGGMPGGMGGLPDFFQDPEIMTAFQDPEVMQAFADVSQNPLNIGKYQNNPKVQKVLEKLASKMGGAGGVPGGMFGGGPRAGGFPPSGAGAGGAASGGPTPKPKPDLDID